MNPRATPAVNALTRATSSISDDEFAAYGGGWPSEIGTALVDAVFSMRARYVATSPGRGVLGRVRRFRSVHPAATDDLAALVEIGAHGIAKVMGNTRSGGRPKSVCVIDAARAMLSLEPPVRTAADAVAAGTPKLVETYRSVSGLGCITAEYFTMLLGIPGVKADRMIVRFVNAALDAAGLPEAPPHTARQLVIDAHSADDRGVSLIAFEHAIWRAKGVLPPVP